MKILLYARKRGRGETLVLELEAKEAMRIIRENRGSNFQLGMLGSTDLNKAVKVYGEFAPYKKVNSVQELLAPFKKEEELETKQGKRKLVHRKLRHFSGKSMPVTLSESSVSGKA